MYIIYICIYLITLDHFLRFYEEFLLKFEDGSHPDVTVVLNRNDAQRIRLEVIKRMMFACLLTSYTVCTCIPCTCSILIVNNFP